MTVKIRLKRTGRKKDPHYRVVAVDSRKKRDGRVLQQLGHYHPQEKFPNLKLDLEKYESFKKEGAQVSDTVRTLVNKLKRDFREKAEEVKKPGKETLSGEEKIEAAEKQKSGKESDKKEPAESPEVSEAPEAGEDSKTDKEETDAVAEPESSEAEKKPEKEKKEEAPEAEGDKKEVPAEENKAQDSSQPESGDKKDRDSD